MGFRAFFAILICKLLRVVCRLLRRGGTALPGRVALRICPGLLKSLALGVKTVAVTGTNGKTTTSRMIEETFIKLGLSYFSNRSGANLISGITTEFVMNSSLSGKCRKDYAIIECDEAAARAVFGMLKPKVAVVTNLFRDQLDRCGEVTHTLTSIREALSKTPDTLICLNADCSLTSSLADTLPNRAVFFGIDASALSKSVEKPDISDATHCIRCKSAYEYDYISFGHLGGFRCPQCGYKRREADYAVTDIVEQGISGSTVIIRVRGEKKLASVNLPALYNVYNALAAVAAVSELGLDSACAIEALATFKCGFGRMEQFELGGGTKMMLVKNPAGCSQVIDYLQNVKEKFALVICLNDRDADGTDVSWIWDASFEKLAALGGRLEKLAVSGDRAGDMRVRLKYAGISDGFIETETDCEKLADWISRQELPVFVMPTYTAMLELREAIVRRCGGTHFWE